MAKAPDKLLVKLLYDTWIDDVRHVSGMTVQLEYARAIGLLNEKKAERADPLPGSE